MDRIHRWEAPKLTGLAHESDGAKVWRLRAGLAGIHSGKLIVRRGSQLAAIGHPAVDTGRLSSILADLGPRFRFRDLLDALTGAIGKRTALEVIDYLKNDAAVIDAPYPDVSSSELLISDATGGFIAPSNMIPIDPIVVAESPHHRAELARVVEQILGKPPRTRPPDRLAATDGDVTLLCTQGLTHDAALEIQDTVAARRRPWMVIADCRDRTMAGPVFEVPHRSTVCHRCLDLRFRAAELSPDCGVGVVSRRFSMASILSVHHLLRLVAAPSHPDLSADLVVSVSSAFEIDWWRVARDPRCTRCSAAEHVDRRPRKPSGSVETGVYPDDDLRTATRRATLERYEAHVGPLDVIQRPRVIDRAPVSGASVCTATVSSPSSNSDGYENRTFLGVGFDERRARLASLSRAAERLNLCAERPDERIISTAKSLGSEALAPRSWAPELAAFDDTRLAWTPATSLTGKGPIMVPSRCVFFPYEPAAGEEIIGWGPHHHGTGCDLGRDAALLWALLELVEVDTITRVDCLGQSGRPVDPNALLDDPPVADLMAALRADERAVWATDHSLDLGIPVIAVHIATRGSPHEVVRGTGAHPCGWFAARHALLEAVRKLVVSTASRPYGDIQEIQSGSADPAKLLDVSRGSVSGDMERTLDRLLRVTDDIVAVDLTHSWSRNRRNQGTELHCVRVIAPGLLGPLSRPSSPRAVSCAPPSSESSTSRDTGRAISTLPALICDGMRQDRRPEVRSAARPPSVPLTELKLVTLGCGVLPDLVDHRLGSLGLDTARYSSAEALFADLDAGRNRPDIVIAALGESPASRMRTWNRNAWRRSIAWIGLTQRGDDVECGPFVAGAPARGCYRCWQIRLSKRDPSVAAFERLAERIPDSAGGVLHAGTRLAVERLLDEVTIVFPSGKSPMMRVHRFQPDERVETEIFIAAPSCPICGNRARRRRFTDNM